MQIIEWETLLKEGLPVGNSFAGGNGFAANNNIAMTVGVFDGVHRGHKALIERIINYEKKFFPVIITFKRNHIKSPKDILSFDQKMTLFEDAGAAVTVVAHLTESFRHMKGAEFLRILRDCGRMGFLAVGSNFRCGYHQDTDAPMIRELNTQAGVPTEIVEVVTEDGAPISSSRIRNAIIEGNLKQAAAMLGRPFVFDLSDVPGKDFVYDTAGLGRVLPPPGRYEVFLHIKNSSAIKANIQIEGSEVKIFLPASCNLPSSSECELIEFLD